MKDDLNLFRNLLILLLILVLAGGAVCGYQLYKNRGVYGSEEDGELTGLRKLISEAEKWLDRSGGSRSGPLQPSEGEDGAGDAQNEASGQDNQDGRSDANDTWGGDDQDLLGRIVWDEFPEDPFDAFPGGERRRVIFIGDSRTVGMYWALSKDQSLHEVHLEDKNGDIWSAREGMGLAWMKEYGVPPVQEEIGENTAVVILMGVNDIGSRITADDYVDYVNEKAQDWTGKGALVYYTSVNPVRETLPNGLSNAKIDEWNLKMQEGLSENVQYIDTNSVITQYRGQFDFKDVLHYRDSTNLDVYRVVMTAIIQ